MESNKKNCSFQGHEKIPANIYCITCKIYMCNKCESFHSKLLQNHKVYTIDKINEEDISQEFCQQEKHNIELQYFCRNHNQLCCAKCITKIKNKENGLHKDCNVCTIEEIKDEKITKLNQNISNLEILSKNLEDSINKLKNIFQKINENKEEVKSKIQKIFTKIRTELNTREDELLNEVDEIFSKNFFGEEIIKQGEKLPNKIKKSLEKCKAIGNLNEENKIVSLINDCTNIENSIKEIDKINESINKFNNLKDVKVLFFPEKEEDSKLIILTDEIKFFGKIVKNDEFFIDSTIINDDNNKRKLIIKWIEEKINKKCLDFKLIFSMNKHGDKCENFHECCDNQGPTLVLIQTMNNKIFGGFTPLNWKSSEDKIIDPKNQTFIFSLDLNKKYNLLNINKQAIKTSNNYGPNFGNDDIQLKKNLREGVCYADSSCSFIVTGGTELTGGKGTQENFETYECEVYKVKY